MEHILKAIFTPHVCWNVFDYSDVPEKCWRLQKLGLHRLARRAALRLTLRHPLRMVPVIIACLRNA